MDVDDERVFLCGVVVLGEGEPALDVEAFVLHSMDSKRGRVGLAASLRWVNCGGLPGAPT